MAGHVTQLVEHLPSMYKVPGSIPQKHIKLGMVVYAYNSSTWAVETG